MTLNSQENKIMNKVTLPLVSIVFFIPFVQTAIAQEVCSSEPTYSVQGMNFYQKCHCKNITYPAFKELAQDYGVKLVSDGIAANNNNWLCGIKLYWSEKPEECVVKKNEFINKMKEIKKVPVSFSSLKCS